MKKWFKLSLASLVVPTVGGIALVSTACNSGKIALPSFSRGNVYGIQADAKAWWQAENGLTGTNTLVTLQKSSDQAVQKANDALFAKQIGFVNKLICGGNFSVDQIKSVDFVAPTPVTNAAADTFQLTIVLNDGFEFENNSTTWTASSNNSITYHHVDAANVIDIPKGFPQRVLIDKPTDKTITVEQSEATWLKNNGVQIVNNFTDFTPDPSSTPDKTKTGNLLKVWFGKDVSANVDVYALAPVSDGIWIYVKAKDATSALLSHEQPNELLQSGLELELKYDEVTNDITAFPTLTSDASLIPTAGVNDQWISDFNAKTIKDKLTYFTNAADLKLTADNVSAIDAVVITDVSGKSNVNIILTLANGTAFKVASEPNGMLVGTWTANVNYIPTVTPPVTQEVQKPTLKTNPEITGVALNANTWFNAVYKAEDKTAMVDALNTNVIQNNPLTASQISTITFDNGSANNTFKVIATLASGFTFADKSNTWDSGDITYKSSSLADPVVLTNVGGKEENATAWIDMLNKANSMEKIENSLFTALPDKGSIKSVVPSTPSQDKPNSFTVTVTLNDNAGSFAIGNTASKTWTSSEITYNTGWTGVTDPSFKQVEGKSDQEISIAGQTDLNVWFNNLKTPADKISALFAAGYASIDKVKDVKIFDIKDDAATSGVKDFSVEVILSDGSYFTSADANIFVTTGWKFNPTRLLINTLKFKDNPTITGTAGVATAQAWWDTVKNDKTAQITALNSILDSTTQLKAEEVGLIEFKADSDTQFTLTINPASGYHFGDDKPAMTPTITFVIAQK